MVQRAQYIDVQSYVPRDDTLDCHAGIQAALNAGYGREIVFSNPYNSSRVYRLLDRTAGTLTMPRKAVVRFDAGATLDFSAWGKSGTVSPVLRAIATMSSVVLTADVAQGSRTITLPAGQGVNFYPGQKIVLNSTERFNRFDVSLNTLGEWLEVGAVTGDVLTLLSATRFAYATASGTVRVHYSDDLCDITVDNPRLIGPGMFTASNTVGDRGIEVVNAERVVIRGGHIQDVDGNSLVITNAYQSLVENFTSNKTEATPGGDTRTRYGIALSGPSSIARIENCALSGGTELISLTLSGSIGGPKQNVLVKGCRLTGAERSGITTHHAYIDLGVEGNEFRDCNQGVDMRLGGRFNDNYVDGMGAGLGNLDCAVQLGAGVRNFTANGNRINDVLRGYWMPSTLDHHQTPGDIWIDGDVMTNVRGHGVRLDYNGSSTLAVGAALGALHVRADITLAGVGAPIGVNTRGRFTNPYVDVTVRGGSASARTVFMDRPSSSAAADGPVNPIIHERYAAPILTSLVFFPANGAGSVKQTTEKFGA
jgi:hypothetical protein